MGLTPTDILSGTLGLSMVLISILLGVIVLSKFFKTKNKNFLLLGINLMFLGSGWFGTSTSFIIALIYGNNGLALETILLLNFIPLPLGLMCWIGFYTNVLMKEKQILFLLIMLAITVFFYIVFFIAMAIDVNLIAFKLSPVDTTSGTDKFLAIYIVIFIAVLLITGLHFSLQTIKYENVETKIKGKFLLIAFPSFTLGALLDSTLPSTDITIVIFRLILISSSIEFYIGYLLPNWIKKRITREA